MSGERADLTTQSLPSLHLHAIAKLISKILEQDNFDFIKIEQSDRQFRVRFDAHKIVKEATKKEYHGKLRQVFRDINESVCLSTNESQRKTLSDYITKIQGQVLEELNKQTKIKTGQEFKEFITDNDIIRTLEDYANLEDGDYIFSIKPKNGKKKDEPSAIANFSHNIQEIGVTSASSDRRLGNVVQAQFETDRAETRDRIIDACLQYISKRFEFPEDDDAWEEIKEMLQEERDENCNKLGVSDLLKILREKVWSQIANFATLKYFDFIKTTLSPKDKKRLEYDEFLKFIKRLEETVTYLENLLDRDEEKEVKFGQDSVPLRRLFAESNYLQKYLPVSPTLEGVYAQGENKNRHLVRYGYKIKLNGAVQKHKCASSYEYSLKVISGKIQPSKFPTNNTYNRITRLILLGLVFLPDPTWLKEKLEQVGNSPDLKKEVDNVVSQLTQHQPNVSRLVAFLEGVTIKKNQSYRYDFTLQLSSSVLNRNILGASEISEVANSLGLGNLFHEDIKSSIYRNSAALRFLTVKSSKNPTVNEPLLQLDGQVIFTVKTLEKIEQEDRFNCKVAWDRGKTRESMTIPVFVGSKNIVENVDEQTQEWVKKQFTIEGLFLSINALDRADGQVENEIQISGFIVYATLAAIFIHTVRNILKEKPVILPFISKVLNDRKYLRKKASNLIK